MTPSDPKSTGEERRCAHCADQVRRSGSHLWVGAWLALTGLGVAQWEFPASVAVEQTMQPVFGDFQPGSGEQVVGHPDELANFRLLMRFRMADRSSALEVHITPGHAVEIPQEPAAVERMLDLRFEHLPGKESLVIALADGVEFARRSIPAKEAESASKPVATFSGGVAGHPARLSLKTRGMVEILSASLQPLANEDHAALISGWNEKTALEGGTIYHQLCVTCHGTWEKEGSLPTSLRFGMQPFKNGTDPFRMFQTITQGYGQMPPAPQYTAAQRYAVIQYIRESFLAPHRPQDVVPVDAAYLTSLPQGLVNARRERPRRPRESAHLLMDYGPSLHWTYQIAPGNIARKALASRLDAGPGGVSLGRAWLVRDLDTMGIAAVTLGTFIDWRNIAFDGSHGTHTSLNGTPLFTQPVGPGWANPSDGSWKDPRPLGTDGLAYGPLPREWARHLGVHPHGEIDVVRYSVGDALVLEAAETPANEAFPGVLRTLNIGKSSRDLKHRIAPANAGLEVRISAPEIPLADEGGFMVMTIPAGRTPLNLKIAVFSNAAEPSAGKLMENSRLPLDLKPLTQGGAARWKEVVETKSVAGDESGPFAMDVFEHPDEGLNPWHSRMQLTGFDFFADGRRAAVCTWLGDVWVVEGIADPAPAELRWRRVASGLFQPLGLKIINGMIHVTCRDQIARLHDTDGDGEADFIECFNNDHQVTEHFHEFAMGLQADAEGNLYYAKSACHEKPAVVPHHGTLLRVSADGSRTDILATGLRAANGVCLNPDGTFFLTDQEGPWTPKNRINLVRGGGPSEFFGNMLGYHQMTDDSDEAMEQPLCWITNRMDRSPGELVWVPENAKWGAFNGSLLSISYGAGRIFNVPFETVNGQVQGGVCPLPMEAAATGIMRGRFHPGDGALYTCGMFSWSGNQQQPGGFYRVRHTGKPALQPLGLHFEKGKIRIRFSDALDPSAAETARHSLRVWGLIRSRRYGSGHVNEREIAVTAAEVSGPDTLILHVPELATTHSIEIRMRLRQADGTDTERIIHATIHSLEKP